MKRLLMTCAAAAVLTVGPAFADGDLYFNVNVDKDIKTTENITVTTKVDAKAKVKVDADKFAESIATANQRNQNNSSCDNCAEKESVIDNSGNNNQGTLSINQATGNFNAQGTVVSAAVDDQNGGGSNGGNGDRKAGFAEASTHAGQINQSNSIDTVNVVYRDATINNSINSNTGNAFANQAVGNMNNQLNLVSLAFSDAQYGVAMADSQLSQENRWQRVSEGRREGDPANFPLNKNAVVSNSLNGNTGVIGVNQAAGNMGNQANVISIAAIGTTGPAFAR
jgi:hypothetical protein